MKDLMMRFGFVVALIMADVLNSCSPISVDAFVLTPQLRSRIHPSRHPHTYKRKDDDKNKELSLSLSATASSTSEILLDGENNEETANNKEMKWLKPTLAIAVPAWIGMMADPLLSLMDTAFVGRVGSVELAALGACTSIFHLAFNAFRATTTATTTLVASATTEEEKHKVIQLSLLLGFAIGWAVLGTLHLLGTWCLSRMGVSNDSPLFVPAKQYLRTRAWAGPAVLGLVVAEGAFRGYGDTRIPLVASMVASLINLVLDPVLMFPPIGLGVIGAAAATALSQVGAFCVYLFMLMKRGMLPRRSEKSNVRARDVILTILGANLAMMFKQGSLLLGWAYATAKATRLGPEHVAAHQVALSFWLVFALGLDGVAVAAQVLTSQSIKFRKRVRSLTKYMLKLATSQGLLSTVLISILGVSVPEVFTKDAAIQHHLRKLMPHLALQQILISLTLVVESLAVGGNQFLILAGGAVISTAAAVFQISQSATVEQIWSRGIVTLFAGRLLVALVGAARINGLFRRKRTLKHLKDV